MVRLIDYDFLSNFNTINKINLYFYPFFSLHPAIKEALNQKAYYFLAGLLSCLRI
jgi:hypothetical protein